MNKIENCNLTDIIIDAQNGVDGAFEKLYKKTIKFSYGVACVLLKNEDDIADVLQNSYMYVAKSIKDLRNPESFESWLSTIVRHECQKHIANRRKASDIFSGIIKAKEIEKISEEDGLNDFVEKKEINDTVREIVDKLPEGKKMCIVLYYFEQCTLPEISEILGIPEGTVKSRLYSGRKFLEKEFKKLQKKDDTFYGISVIPLVTAFFAYQVKNIAVPASIAEGASLCIAAAEGAAAVSAASTAAASVSSASAATGVSAAGTAGTAVAAKVTAVAVAAAVATGGGAATVNYISSQKETSPPQTSITEEYTTAAVSEKETTIVLTETSTAYITTVTESESVKTEAAVTETTSAAATTEAPTSKAAKTTRVRTTKKPTTVNSSTTAPASTTTAETTTEKETTTKEPTTTEKTTTTQPEARKSTTTAAPTTDAADIYGISDGVLNKYTGEGGSVSIPSSIGGSNVTAIGTGAFAGNSDITSVSVPSTVTKIGQEAFAECTSLKSVSLPSSLQSIGIGSFCGCTGLTSIGIPSGVTTIGDDAFADCSSLSTITIPSSVTSIGDNAFGGCDNLTIRCAKNSAAHTYAVENSIEFELI